MSSGTFKKASFERISMTSSRLSTSQTSSCHLEPCLVCWNTSDFQGFLICRCSKFPPKIQFQGEFVESRTDRIIWFTRPHKHDLIWNQVWQPTRSSTLFLLWSVMPGSHASTLMLVLVEEWVTKRASPRLSLAASSRRGEED